MDGCEGKLWLNHPEFAEMTGGVGVLGSEGWAEGVAVTKSNSESLNVELTTDTQKCWLGEHVLFVINNLLFKGHGSEVEKMIVTLAFCVLLFLFVFLWLLTLSCVLGCLFLLGLFLGLLHSLDFLGGLWDFQMSLELSLGDWLIVIWKHGSNLEHLSSTLAVRGSDDWGVDVQESSLLEELMSGESKVVSHSGDSTEGVGSCSQMSLFSQGLSNIDGEIENNIGLTSRLGLP